ncbi:hypothetical protein ABZ349_34905, partial [Streptomyces niveus]|uniref:hypothetical protein n=1 Tax=Streptomyces niveus TaxID=193462 RepID=UPI0033D3116B
RTTARVLLLFLFRMEAALGLIPAAPSVTNRGAKCSGLHMQPVRRLRTNRQAGRARRPTSRIADAVWARRASVG